MTSLDKQPGNNSIDRMIESVAKNFGPSEIKVNAQVEAANNEINTFIDNIDAEKPYSEKEETTDKITYKFYGQDTQNIAPSLYPEGRIVEGLEEIHITKIIKKVNGEKQPESLSVFTHFNGIEIKGGKLSSPEQVEGFVLGAISQIRKQAEKNN